LITERETLGEWWHHEVRQGVGEQGFCLAFYITQGPDLGFASATALAVLGASILSFIAFLVAEKVSRRPLFDFSVFRTRPFSGAIIGSSAMNLSYWPFMVYLPIWFHVESSWAAGPSPSSTRSPSLSGFEVLVFKEAVIGDAHVFRMAYREIAVVCDDTLRNACKAAKLKGLHFRDALSGDR
jgi:hypothetical protein